jgi:hypothetical protein
MKLASILDGSNFLVLGARQKANEVDMCLISDA